ncbi:MAG: hypothetical protein ACJ71T_14770 [Actinomycetales bacterium]
MSIRRSLSGRRRPTAIAFASVAATLVLVLGAAGCSGGSTSAGQPGPADSTALSTTSSTTSSSSSTTATASPTTARTPYPTTTTAHTEPWTLKDADFGFVLSAVTVSGGVEITFDRATWLLASQIKAWNKANPDHPAAEADDYAIGNVSTKKRTFLVRTGAKIFGSVILGDQPEPQRITASQLVARMKTAIDGVSCWLYHQYGGLTGDVVQLEEQYRP